MSKRWSTKNLHILHRPTDAVTGVGVFEFTDDYSVFHFGKMPDRIDGKGEAIARIAALNFDLFAKQGIETHFRGLVAPDRIEFRLLRILDPAVEPIEPGSRNYFIPLQVVFRNSLPAGSSVFRRMARGTATPAQFGWSRVPQPGTVLDPPVIEFMTKLEEIDRFIDESEARRLAALSDEQMRTIKALTLAVNDVVTRKAGSSGLHHADGKLEFGVGDEGRIMLVDVAGTPDENRFVLNGFDVGKQIMRDHYASMGLEVKVQEWAAQGVSRTLWEPPPRLPRELLASISQVYKSLAEAWTGESIWSVPPLDEAVRTVRSLGADVGT